jgi:hypothetical protein
MRITRKQAFYFLKKRDLIDISKKFGYAGLSVLNKDQLVQKLLGDSAIKKADIIGQLTHADLKSLCLAIGLKPTGTKKALIASILGKKIESKSPKKSKPVSKTHVAKKAKIGEKSELLHDQRLPTRIRQDQKRVLKR